MPEWLKQTLGSDLEVSPWEMAVRLVLALACGGVIAAIYRLVRRREVVAPSFPPTLVLLAILCAMLPQVIGENVARAFGLVGALSIVRFRTVVEDTYDIAFVIFAVLVGMAVGANHLSVALVGIAVVGFAAFVVHPRRAANQWTDADSTLSVRIGVGRDPDAIVQTVFEKHLTRSDLVSGATGRQGAAIDLTYKVRFRDGAAPTELIDELNRVEGVQGVELQRA
jgi:uncharacterized membrane protein YhiD involved in acid resistance